MTHRTLTALAIAALVAVAPSFAAATLFSQGTIIEGTGGPYVPAGTLYDNEQNNGTTSLVSQDSNGAFVSRSADDFILDGANCPSGLFDITQVRLQMVQRDTTPQTFGVDFFADNGAGTAPTPAGAIVPIASYTEISQSNLGPFGVGTSAFEAGFDTTGLQLPADTVLWISGFGTDAAGNAAAFNNFFAASGGATGTTANGVTIAPGQGVTAWTPSGPLIGGADLAYSFAIDGACAAGAINPLEIPTISSLGIAALVAALAALSLMLIVRRRRNEG